MDIHAEITARAEELRLAMRGKLGVRGASFAKTVDRAGRLLPSRLRKQAAVIVMAQGLGGHPKLMRMVDMGAIHKAHREIAGFLDGIDLKEQRRTQRLRWFGSIVFNLLVVAVCFVIWLVWSGNA